MLPGLRIWRPGVTFCVPIVRLRVLDGSALSAARAASVAGDVGILKVENYGETGIMEKVKYEREWLCYSKMNSM